MEAEFRTLVGGNINFNGVSLEEFSALPEADVAIYFDTSTIPGTNFKSKVMALRKRFNQQTAAAPQDNSATEALLAKKRKSVEEASRAKDTCPQFFEESMLVAQELQASKDQIDTLKSEALATIKDLMKHKDEIHSLQAERTVYLKAALKMFQRGIIELELQVFLGIHTTRSKNNKQFLCGNPPVSYNCDFSTLMRHWRTCTLHSSPPVIVDKKQVEARQFKSTIQNVENAVDNLYMSLSTSQHFKTDYPIKLTPFVEDADTLALVSFLEFYKVDYCLLCDEQGVVDTS